MSASGNPPNPNGHKTAYLWEEVFIKESLAGIIQHFVLLEGKITDPLAKKTLIFPRYHQLEVVRRLLAHAATTGVGHSYLIQHSAGSGKSNSITWTAYQLIETYPTKAGIPGAKLHHAAETDNGVFGHRCSVRLDCDPAPSLHHRRGCRGFGHTRYTAQAS